MRELVPGVKPPELRFLVLAIAKEVDLEGNGLISLQDLQQVLRVVKVVRACVLPRTSAPWDFPGTVGTKGHGTWSAGVTCY